MAKGIFEFVNILPMAILFTGITYVATKDTKISSIVGAAGYIVPNFINMLELRF